MKIVFLDFDGVLCNYESITTGYKKRTAPEEDPYGAHPACVAALNQLTAASGALIVVSSTWRKVANAPVVMSRTLRRWGVQARCIGVTPILNGSEYTFRRRGAEIQFWLAQHPLVKSFVILDDDSDMGQLRPWLIQTDYRAGLTEADVGRALALLSEQPAGVTL